MGRRTRQQGTIIAKIRCGAIGCNNGFSGPVVSDGWYAQLPIPAPDLNKFNDHAGWLIELGETPERNLVRCPKHCRFEGKSLATGGKWVWDD